MPYWAKIAAAVLYPLSGIAALTAGGLSYSYPGGWLMLVVAVLPPLIALYAMWARLPALHTTFRPDVTSAVLLGAIGVVILATLPLAYVDELLFPGRLARQEGGARAATAEHEMAGRRALQTRRRRQRRRDQGPAHYRRDGRAGWRAAALDEIPCRAGPAAPAALTLGKQPLLPVFRRRDVVRRLTPIRQTQSGGCR